MKKSFRNNLILSNTVKNCEKSFKYGTMLKGLIQNI